MMNISSDSFLSHCDQRRNSIVDLFQSSSNEREIKSMIIDDEQCQTSFSDLVDQNQFQSTENRENFDLQQSLTDQWKNVVVNSQEISSDNRPSQLDLIPKPRENSKSSKIVVQRLKPSIDCSSSNFLWSKYLSIVDERAVSEEFFDHYLTSIRSALQIEMKLEFCYDVQRDLYWLAQIQLVSHRLIRLHYLGIPDNDNSEDFWADVYGGRCHPIGWCKDNSKLMIPPAIVTKRAVQNPSIHLFNPISVNNKSDQDQSPTPLPYVFEKTFGLTPIEQLKVGMFFEVQDEQRPWTLWFVRIEGNRGGRLHLRYVVHREHSDCSMDIHLFYLHWRLHPIGWTLKNASKYFYDFPSQLKINEEKQSLIDWCFEQSKNEFLPENFFAEQEEIREHRFRQGMKLEVFDWINQKITCGQIEEIHNEFFFDVLIENEIQTKFVAHASHPFLLPAHWAVEHRLALIKGKNLRQSEDFWTSYTEKHGVDDIASERCFHLITLNGNGTNRVEPGMKMELIFNYHNEDLVFSVTLVSVIDHLMWLRIDNRTLFDEQNDEHLFYQVVPINSLNIFPVGWAKANGFPLIAPPHYNIEIETFEEDRTRLFSSVTHFARIPRVYLGEFFQLTLYVNIRCFVGPHFCSSRLARIPSQFGPGPYRHVLRDLFHHLLSASSTNAHRALRRLEHLPNIDGTNPNLKTEFIKASKKATKLIRPVALPTTPYLIHQYLRHVCTQLETCPNLVSMKRVEHLCPDKCHLLSNTFALSIHSKHKRTGAAQLRAAQQRQRKQKSLLCHLKANSNSSTPLPTSLGEEIPSIDSPSEQSISIESSQTVSNETINPSPIPPPGPPGSDRKTRGFRVHIEPRTHTVTRTNRKVKSSSNIKEEAVDSAQTIKIQSSATSVIFTQDSNKLKRSRHAKRSSSPHSVASSSVTWNILSSMKNKKKRRTLPTLETFPSPSEESNHLNDLPTPSNLVSNSLPILPSQNPVTWNVNDVCSYLNQSGCSFALKTIQEQEIDGAALLLLDDLPKVQDLLEFKLGPAVKFCHVVEQLRTQVIETFHSSPSLKPKRFSTNTS